MGSEYRGARRAFLLTAGLIGATFKAGATISAAAGGCQAEIAMEHHLGLTCDPVGGLVQIPCIERNTMGAIKAVTSAHLAVGGDADRAKVTLDDVVRAMRETAREFPHLQLSCGADDLALEFFAWGAESWVCAAANFFAKESIALYEACAVRNDFVTGRRLLKAMMPVMTVLERGGKFVQCVKYGCELDGLPAGKTVRLPLRPMKKELKRELRDAIATARTTIRQISGEVKNG